MRGMGGTCPPPPYTTGLILNCAFATWVLNNSFADVQTAKVYYEIHFGRLYDSIVGISLHFGIFPTGWCLDHLALWFIPTYFTF